MKNYSILVSKEYNTNGSISTHSSINLLSEYQIVKPEHTAISAFNMGSDIVTELFEKGSVKSYGGHLIQLVFFKSNNDLINHKGEVIKRNFFKERKQTKNSVCRGKKIKFLSLWLEDGGLSCRAFNKLKSQHIQFFWEIPDLMKHKIRNFGKKFKTEIEMTFSENKLDVFSVPLELIMEAKVITEQKLK